MTDRARTTWYRNSSSRYPFLWVDATQPGGRWHATGEGPANCFADTPDGAWAEFLRHEEITTVEDLAGISRAIWSVEISLADTAAAPLPRDVLVGDRSSYPACRAAARDIRSQGADSLTAPSAALKAGEAAGWRVDGAGAEQRCPPPRDGHVLVVFGPPADRVQGWLVASDARPPARLLDSVRHFGGA